MTFYDNLFTKLSTDGRIFTEQTLNPGMLQDGSSVSAIKSFTFCESAQCIGTKTVSGLMASDHLLLTMMLPLLIPP